MSKEQSILTAPLGSGAPAKIPVTQRLKTVRIWFYNGIVIMEDIKSKGLDDVVLDAIVL
ncbi:hypothetical protein N7449_005083 [Penicillium cf. viridicatum]|uniref:Uncharacterized protein n=1 Tax=Penicillium cf. viridicatum TaxID=2972119 RepID=A0A9W9MKM9_9EURO|nr:hypothetical protein N7449_005083 [Penicillium cf. viridicatum]